MRTIRLNFVLGEPYLLHGNPVSISGFPQGVKVELTRADTGQKLIFTRSELGLLAMRGAFCPLNGPQDPQPAEQPVLDLDALPAKDRARGERRLAYAKALVPYGPLSPKSSAFGSVVRVVAQRLADPHSPSPHSAYRWLRRYTRSGHDTGVFFGEARIRHHRKSRLPTEVREALEQKLIDALGSNAGATLHRVFDTVVAQVAQEQGFDAYRAISGETKLARGPIPPIITHDSKRKPRKSSMRKSTRPKPKGHTDGT